MIDPAIGFARAADELVGSPFRLHGRNPATGLDCIGLVVAALGSAGHQVHVPQDYHLRNLSIDHLLPGALLAGFEPASGLAAAGDLLLLKPGPGQFHIAITGLDGGIIHAHAGLGRVVRTPGPLHWPLLRHWRLRSN